MGVGTGGLNFVSLTLVLGVLHTGCTPTPHDDGPGGGAASGGGASTGGGTTGGGTSASTGGGTHTATDGGSDTGGGASAQTTVSFATPTSVPTQTYSTWITPFTNVATAVCTGVTPEVSYTATDIIYTATRGTPPSALTAAEGKIDAATGILTALKPGVFTVTAAVATQGGCPAATASYTYELKKAAAYLRFDRPTVPSVTLPLRDSVQNPINTASATFPNCLETYLTTTKCPTGGITYASGDTAVATVDAGTGAVTVLLGDSSTKKTYATITAFMAADDFFLPATASYIVRVSLAPIPTYELTPASDTTPETYTTEYGAEGWNTFGVTAAFTCTGANGYPTAANPSPVPTFQLLSQYPASNGATIDAHGTLTLLSASGAGEYTVEAKVVATTSCAEFAASYTYIVTKKRPVISFANRSSAPIPLAAGKAPTSVATVTMPDCAAAEPATCAAPVTDGRITYSSSNPEIADFEDPKSSVLTPKAVGTVVVRAVYWGDANYSNTTAITAQEIVQ